VLLNDALSQGAARLFGLDIDAAMVDLVHQRVPSAFTKQGGVAQLRDFGEINCLIAANVMAYMTDEEDDLFYQRAVRVQVAIKRRRTDLVAPLSDARGSPAMQ
jgi:hypothetical protein